MDAASPKWQMAYRHYQEYFQSADVPKLQNARSLLQGYADLEHAYNSSASPPEGAQVPENLPEAEGFVNGWMHAVRPREEKPWN